LLVALYAIFVGTGFGRELDASAVRHDLTGGWDEAADFLVYAVSPLSMAIAVVILVWLAVRDGRPSDGVRAAALVAGSVILADRLKPVLGDLDLVGGEGARELGSAFYPSGHAAAVMSVCLAALLVWPPVSRFALVLGAALCSSAWGVAIYGGGSHHPSDVIGGFLVALVAASIVVIGRSATNPADHRERGSPISALGVAVGALAALCLVLEGARRLSMPVGPLEAPLVLAGGGISATAFAVVIGFEQVLERGTSTEGPKACCEAANGE
jgi:membrane-associated phospholipid phosphatase